MRGSLLLLLVALWTCSCSGRAGVKNLADNLVKALQQRNGAALLELFHPDVRACLRGIAEQLAVLPASRPRIEIFELPRREMGKLRGLAAKQRWLISLKWGDMEQQFPAGEVGGRPMLLADGFLMQA